MIRAMRTAASGMLAQQMQVDSIANNIANVNTTSFKKDSLAFRTLLYRTYREPGAVTTANLLNPTGLQIGSGTEIASSIKLHVQGDLEPTGNELDIAINGPGFYRVRLGNGEFRYTRDGTFRKDANGDLVTVDGYRLEPNVNIPADAESISVAQDGTVTVSSASTGAGKEVGQILLIRFPNPAGLKAVGSNLYQETLSSGVAVPQTAGANGMGFLRGGFKERSNVQIVDELIELIQAQRNYEVNSRTIRVGDEMLQQVSNLVR
jgi:flagellar basal-body rod protein FlgG